MKIKLNEADEILKRLEATGLKIQDYKKGYKKIMLSEDNFKSVKTILKELFKLSYDQY